MDGIEVGRVGEDLGTEAHDREHVERRRVSRERLGGVATGGAERLGRQ